MNEVTLILILIVTFAGKKKHVNAFSNFINWMPINALKMLNNIYSTISLRSHKREILD